MILPDLYTNELVEKAFIKLQKDRDSSESALRTFVEGPETVKKEFVREWLAFNYLFALDNKEDYSPLMGQIGGVIGNLDNGTKVIAVSDGSVARVNFGFQAIRYAEETQKDYAITEMEHKIEMPLEYRSGLTIVNGNINVAHYDFTTAVGYDDVTDILSTNMYLLLGASGLKVITNKLLPGEQYIFSVPFHESIFDRFKAIPGEDLQSRLDILKSEDIVPENFTPGFHIIYKGKEVRVRPLIVDSDLPSVSGWIYEEDMTVTDSCLGKIGLCDGYGRLNKLFSSGLFS